MKKNELQKHLTGTEEPRFITERESEMIDKFLELIPEINKGILRNFFYHGMEAANCDQCGDKGTGLTFENIYQKHINTTP